jgi:hypothetical protein
MVKLIRPKGRAMRKFSSGLHKDVPTIFDGVWNPAKDNLQPAFEATVANSVASVNFGTQVVEDWPRESRLGGFLRTCKEAPGFLFRSRARRERKRLLSISKHLMINMQG